MEKEFIPYELALALKKLGFDETCFGYYESTYGKEKVIIEPSKLITNSNYSKVFNEIRYRIVTPTFSQAFRFFREKYPELDFGVGKIHNGTNNYHYHINLQWEFFEGTYEEAELACLKKLIEIVKNLK